MHDDWTTSHDLALIYFALAYGPDHQLAERELALIDDALSSWTGGLADIDGTREIALEALAVLLDGSAHPETLISEALDRLAESLSHEQRQRAIEDLIRIAEADGIFLRAERAVIALIARRWQVKQHAQLLLSVTRGEQEDWTLMHDIGLVYVILAHSTDNQLSDREITAIVARAAEWQPSWNEEMVRSVLRAALAYYSTNPGAEGLQRSVLSIGHRLPLMQRLALINDLFAIAESDGAMLEAEREMINAFMEAWNVGPVFPEVRPRVSTL